jgi:hypothetical protein
MKYAVEMGSGAMIYVPSFIKIGSGIRKLIGGDTQACRQHGERISLLFFLKIRKVDQKWKASQYSYFGN